MTVISKCSKNLWGVTAKANRFGCQLSLVTFSFISNIGERIRTNKKTNLARHFRQFLWSRYTVIKSPNCWKDRSPRSWWRWWCIVSLNLTPTSLKVPTLNGISPIIMNKPYYLFPLFFQSSGECLRYIFLQSCFLNLFSPADSVYTSQYIGVHFYRELFNPSLFVAFNIVVNKDQYFIVFWAPFFYDLGGFFLFS